MSPEQVRDPHHVDGRSDLYSLGVILYHLLTGELPFRGVTRMVLEQVQHDEPRPPRRLNDKIPRDLETITLKCLAKEPGRRYQTAGELAADLRRWLAGRPITARPAGRGERCWRWCRRQPALASLIAALVLVVSGGFGGVLGQWRRAEEQRRRAEEGYEQARQAVDRFLTRMSEETLLNEPGFQPLRRKLLEDALAFYQDFLRDRGDDPTVRGQVATAYRRIGAITGQLDAPEKALAFYQKGMEILEELVRARPQVLSFQLELAKTYHRMAVLLEEDTSKLGDARPLREKALVLSEQLVRANPAEPDYQRLQALCHFSLGFHHGAAGEPDKAIRSFEQARVLQEQLVAAHPENPEFQRDLGRTHANTAYQYELAGRFDEALRSYQHACSIDEKVTQEKPDVLNYRADLADDYSFVAHLQASRGEWADALRLYDRARHIQEELVTRNPAVTAYQQDLARSLGKMGMLQLEVGQSTDALNSTRQARSLFRKLARDYPSVPKFQTRLAESELSLGHIHETLGRLDEALRSYEAAQAITKKLTEENPTDADYARCLAGTYIGISRVQWAKGHPAEAQTSAQQAHDLLEKLARTHPDRIEFQSQLAANFVRLADLLGTANQEEAHRALEQARTLQERLARDHPAIGRYQTDLAETYFRIAFLPRKDVPLEEALRLCEQARSNLERLDAAAWPPEPPRPLDQQRRDLSDRPLSTGFNVPRLKDDLAASYHNIGLLQHEAGRLAQAYQSLQRARELHGELVQKLPEVPYFQDQLANSHGAVGGTHGETARRAAVLAACPPPSVFLAAGALRAASLHQAIGCYQRSCDLTAEVVRNCPDVVEYRHNLACALETLGDGWWEVGRRDRALAAYQQAVAEQRAAVARAPQVKQYQTRLGFHLYRLAYVHRELGQHAEAAAASLERLRLDPRPIDRYDVACALALCIPLVGQGQTELSAEEHAQRQKYADQAMAVLRDAVEQGYTDLAHMKRDSDLDPLRPRDDFRKLMAGLEARANEAPQQTHQSTDH